MAAGTNYAALLDFTDSLSIVDSHEHLLTEAQRLATPVDFALLFAQYCRCDMGAAGMTEAMQTAFYSSETPLDEKWRLFEPFYRHIQDGGYCRAAHLAMEKFYGYPRLESLDDAVAVTEAMRAANVAGLYRRVLREACNIRVSLNYGGIEHDPEYMLPVVYVSGFLRPNKPLVLDFEERLGASCATLDGYVDAVRRELRALKEKGAKGFKFDLAYMRDLHFPARTHDEAERVFLRVLEEGYGWRPDALGYEEGRPLQDYLVHRIAEEAGVLELPIVFHTGLQASSFHNPDDARPQRLWNLAHRHRKTRFVVLHAGMPWLEEAAMLAKQYPNVYLDLAWTHIISPSLSRRALHAFIDLVPMNKVSGFGGDYFVVEKVYGHLTLARQNIARALAERIDEGAMPLSRAQAWAKALFVDNPTEIFRIA